jgi:hypothetical protein
LKDDRGRKWQWLKGSISGASQWGPMLHGVVMQATFIVLLHKRGTTTNDEITRRMSDSSGETTVGFEMLWSSDDDRVDLLLCSDK